MASSTEGSPPTARELEVLYAVCRPGGSIATAAHDLGISPYTAKNYLRSLYLRLGVNSAAQARHALDGPNVPLSVEREYA